MDPHWLALIRTSASLLEDDRIATDFEDAFFSFSLSPSNYSNLTASSSLPVVTFYSVLLQIRPWTHFLWFQNLNAKFQSIDALANAYSTYYSSLKTSSFHLLSSCGKEGALILSFLIMWNASCLENKQTVFCQKVDRGMKKWKVAGKRRTTEVWRKEELSRKGGKADSDLLCSAIPGLHQLIEHVTLLRIILKGRVCYLLVAARADCCQGRVEICLNLHFYTVHSSCMI